jgi:hypothetical protein
MVFVKRLRLCSVIRGLRFPVPCLQECSSGMDVPEQRVTGAMPNVKTLI